MQSSTFVTYTIKLHDYRRTWFLCSVWPIATYIVIMNKQEIECQAFLLGIDPNKRGPLMLPRVKLRFYLQTSSWHVEHWRFIFFVILKSPQKSGHIMIRRPPKRKEEELQVSHLTVRPVYQEMSMY